MFIHIIIKMNVALGYFVSVQHALKSHNNNATICNFHLCFARIKIRIK